MSPLVDPLLSTLDLSKPGMHSGAIAQSRLAQPWQVGVDFVVLKPWHKIDSFDGSKKSAIGGSSSRAHGGETRRFLHFVCFNPPKSTSPPLSLCDSWPTIARQTEESFDREEGGSETVLLWRTEPA